jgi:CarD family transcriptional regulator
MGKLRIGDTVVHPLYGVGTLVSVQEEGEKGMDTDYYVIELKRAKARLLTPVNKAEDVGLRKPISKKQRAKLLRVLGGTPRRLPGEYPQRRKKITNASTEGSFVDIGRVVRDLAWRASEGEASVGDRRLLRRAKDLLAVELAASDGIEEEEAMEGIEAVLEQRVSKWQEESR